MNKKVNTALFFVVATLINLVLTAAIGAVLFIPYALLLGRHATGSNNLLALLIILTAAMIGTMQIYQRLLTKFQKKVDIDKYFDPIVKLPPRRSRRS